MCFQVEGTSFPKVWTQASVRGLLGVRGASKEGPHAEQERAYLPGEARARLTSTPAFSEGFGCGLSERPAGDLGAGGVF